MANGYVCFLRVDVGSGSPFTYHTYVNDMFMIVKCF